VNIHAVTVCIGYADYLEATISLSDIVTTRTIVTSINDYKTLSIGSDKTILYEDYKSPFNKSKLVNAGLQYVYSKYPNDWYLLLDADTYIERVNDIGSLDQSKLYGVVRKLYKNKSDLQNGIYTLDTHLEENIPYSVMGYFQLFKKSYIFYDESFNTAFGSDTKFLLDHFGFENSATIGQDKLIAHHLGPKDTNWDGRISQLWT